MGENSVLLILGIGGLALVCLTLIGALLLFVLRLARGPIFSFFGLLARGTDDNDDDSDFVRRPSRATPNLRAIAQQSDFDSAVAARQLNSDTPPIGGVIQSQRAPSPLGSGGRQRLDLGAGDADDDGVPPALRRERRPRKDDRADREDEIFGGMLDFDGDGRPDV